jgi:hypothetical protein
VDRSTEPTWTTECFGLEPLAIEPISHFYHRSTKITDQAHFHAEQHRVCSLSSLVEKLTGKRKPCHSVPLSQLYFKHGEYETAEPPARCSL